MNYGRTELCGVNGYTRNAAQHAYELAGSAGEEKGEDNGAPFLFYTNVAYLQVSLSERELLDRQSSVAAAVSTPTFPTFTVVPVDGVTQVTTSCRVRRIHCHQEPRVRGGALPEAYLQDEPDLTLRFEGNQGQERSRSLYVFKLPS